MEILGMWDITCGGVVKELKDAMTNVPVWSQLCHAPAYIFIRLLLHTTALVL